MTTSNSTDPRPLFRKAVATATPIVAAARADQLKSATPCPEFTVAQLLDHLILVLDRVAAIGREGDGTIVSATERGEGWIDAWEASAKDCEAAWTDESLDRQVILPWTKMGGADALRIYISEVTVHTWDLATATGQHPAWDPAVVGTALDAMHRELPAEGRKAALEEALKHLPAGTPVSFPFAEAVPVAGDAPLIDRLIGLTGRRP